MSVKSIVSQLKKASKAYYFSENPIMTDKEYDDLIDELKKLDPTNKYLKEIGSLPKNKIELPFPMGSLNKIKKDINEWKHTNDYIISDKLDGVSCQLFKNEDGDIFFYTRGTENYGQDITKLMSSIISKKILKKIPNNTSIRGELVISKENFKKILDKKNARNTVAGIVNSKKPDTDIIPLVDFVVYNILHPSYCFKDQLELLQSYGLNVVKYKHIQKLDDKTLIEYALDRQNNGEYDIDGIVVADNSKIYELQSGNPDYMIAFKPDILNEKIICTVDKIDWNITMNRYIKPVAILETPVSIGGVTITNVTAFNAKFVKDNGLGKGAIIEITRSGNVIPDITRVIKSVKPDFPDIDYEWNETNVDIVADENDDFVTQKVNVKLLLHFFRTMDIKYTGEENINKLSEEHNINNILDLLNIKDRSILYEIEGLGKKSIDKLFDQIDEAFSKCDLPTLMAASHIFGRGFGRRKIKEILKIYPNLLTLKLKEDELLEKILEIDGFGEKLAEKFVENYNTFIQFFKSLLPFYPHLQKLADPPTLKKSKENKYIDQIIVMSGFRDSNLQKLIEENGGKVTTSVSSKTTLLIVKNKNEQSEKIQKAKQLGIPIVTIDEFNKQNMT